MCFRTANGLPTAIQLVATYDGTNDARLIIDPITNAIVAIDFPHHEIHTKCSFTTEHVDAGPMADAATLILAFMTPNTSKLSHIFFAFTTLVAGYLTVWEGPTWDAGTGVLVPIVNRYRDPPLVSSVLLEDRTGPGFAATDNVIANPTNFAGGTNLMDRRAWGSTPRPALGGIREVDELPFARNQTYGFVFTADGANNAAQIVLNWYEHLNER